MSNSVRLHFRILIKPRPPALGLDGNISPCALGLVRSNTPSALRLANTFPPSALGLAIFKLRPPIGALETDYPITTQEQAGFI